MRRVLMSLVVLAACGDAPSDLGLDAAPTARRDAGSRMGLDATTVADASTLADASTKFTGTIAEGTFDLVAANAFGDPGFHEPLSATHTLPANLPPVSGRRLFVRLRDTQRGNQTCDRDHPLSGCATVDWSDFLGRPKVPAGGVFDNRLTLETASGTRTYYLSETGDLADVPDVYVPT